MRSPRTGWRGLALGVVLLLTAVGTILWIVAIMRPVPPPAPFAVRVLAYRAATLDLAIDLGRTAGDGAAIERAGDATLAFGRQLASGGALVAGPVRVLHLSFAVPANPPTAARSEILRLVYDSGILSAGAVSGASPDHILGLAGEGTAVPAAGRAMVHDYCGTLQTAIGDFCKRFGQGPAAADKKISPSP